MKDKVKAECVSQFLRSLDFSLLSRRSFSAGGSLGGGSKCPILGVAQPPFIAVNYGKLQGDTPSWSFKAVNEDKINRLPTTLEFLAQRFNLVI
jgi:hypothetical protein